MANQTELGKAFEYACVKAFYKNYKDYQSVMLEDTVQMQTAKKFYNNIDYSKKNKMDLAAKAAVRVIDRLEPQLRYPDDNIPLILTLQADAEGMAGDVRDVLCIRRQNKWQIGLSCKHNHHAVKHSRLSDKIDFGKEWFGKKCSKQYFDEVVPLFTELRKMKADGKSKGKPILWDDIEDKFGMYYAPILKSFMDELKRMSTKYPNEIPKRLIQYLIGRYDFYKVITDDRHRTTRVEAVNIGGSLNKISECHQSIVKVPVLKLPSRFYHIGFKKDSQNTIEVVCDEGWTISMRLHNASKRIEPSLKFDVNLLSLPQSIHAQVEPWDNDGLWDIDHKQDIFPSQKVAEDRKLYDRIKY